MPKFLTYQRPAAVNKEKWGKPGVAYGKPGKQMPKGAPKAAPEPHNPVLDIKLPGLLPKR